MNKFKVIFSMITILIGTTGAFATARKVVLMSCNSFELQSIAQLAAICPIQDVDCCIFTTTLELPVTPGSTLKAVFHTDEIVVGRTSKI